MDYQVTIIMSNYNQEKYISAAIDSVLMQKVSFDYQLIITDDNSTKDNSLDIIKSYEKKYPEKIKVLYNKENGKYLKNILRAKAITKTPYFCLLDADDYWTDDGFLQRAFDFLERNNEYVIYEENVNYLNSDGSLTPFINSKEESYSFDLNDYLNCKDIITQTTGQFYRNVIFINGIPQIMSDAVGTTSERSFEGDFDRCVMHLKYGKAYFYNNICGVYRILDSGIWAGLKDFEKNILQMQTYFDYNRYFDFSYKSCFVNRMYNAFCTFLESYVKYLKMLPNAKMTSIQEKQVEHIYNYIMENKDLITFHDTASDKVRYIGKGKRIIHKISSLLKKLIRNLLFLFVNKNLVIVKIDGGICSQMAQYAEGLLFEKRKVKYDLSWFKDDGYDLLHKDKRNFDLLKLFPELKFKKASNLELALYKKKYSTNETDFDLLTKNKTPMYLGSYYHYPLEGYKQFYRIFNFHKIRINEESKKVLEKIKRDAYSCAVHVRRGDLADNETAIKSGYLAGVCTEHYFVNTIKYIANLNPACKFYLFSDDLGYVEKCILPLLGNYNCELVTANNAENGYLDLYLMAHCNCQISSLGSLAIYGWLLNAHEDKLLITTKETYYKCANKNAALFTNNGELIENI